MAPLGTPPRLLVPVMASVLLTGLLAGLTGCGSDNATSGSPSPSTTTATQTATQTVTQTATPTPSGGSSDSPTATGSPSASGTGTPPPAAPDALLLPANALPGFNPGWRWQQRSTGAQHGPLGVCQRFPMQTLGAERTVVRTFGPADGAPGPSAAHLVSRFVDEKSADQAVAVLRTWHDRCRERLEGYGFRHIGPLTSVATPRGQASRYLVRFARKGADTGTFESLGVLRSGSTVEVLRLSVPGQDYPAPDPMVKALQNAAARLP